jgi:hypothetical protein
MEGREPGGVNHDGDTELAAACHVCGQRPEQSPGVPDALVHGLLLPLPILTILLSTYDPPSLCQESILSAILSGSLKTIVQRASGLVPALWPAQYLAMINQHGRTEPICSPLGGRPTPCSPRSRT